MHAERLDGSVLLAGCDKSLPGMLMAAARLDLAAVFLYAGSTLPGTPSLGRHREQVTIIDAFEAVGACARGPDQPRGRRPRSSGRSAPARVPAAACTPPTRWPSAAEALGMSLPGSAPRRRRPTAAATAYAAPVRRGGRRAARRRHHRARRS